MLTKKTFIRVAAILGKAYADLYTKPDLISSKRLDLIFEDFVKFFEEENSSFKALTFEAKVNAVARKYMKDETP